MIADKSWFEGIEKATKDILVWGGGGEALIDSIEAIAKQLKEAFPKTEVVVEVSIPCLLVSGILANEFLSSSPAPLTNR